MEDDDTASGKRREEAMDTSAEAVNDVTRILPEEIRLMVYEMYFLSRPCDPWVLYCCAERLDLDGALVEAAHRCVRARGGRIVDQSAVTGRSMQEIVEAEISRSGARADGVEVATHFGPPLVYPGPAWPRFGEGDLFRRVWPFSVLTLTLPVCSGWTGLKLDVTVAFVKDAGFALPVVGPLCSVPIGFDTVPAREVASSSLSVVYPDPATPPPASSEQRTGAAALPCGFALWEVIRLVNWFYTCKFRSDVARVIRSILVRQLGEAPISTGGPMPVLCANFITKNMTRFALPAGGSRAVIAVVDGMERRRSAGGLGSSDGRPGPGDRSGAAVVAPEDEDLMAAISAGKVPFWYGVRGAEIRGMVRTAKGMTLCLESDPGLLS